MVFFGFFYFLFFCFLCFLFFFIFIFIFIFLLEGVSQWGQLFIISRMMHQNQSARRRIGNCLPCWSSNSNCFDSCREVGTELWLIQLIQRVPKCCPQTDCTGSAKSSQIRLLHIRKCNWCLAGTGGTGLAGCELQ